MYTSYCFDFNDKLFRLKDGYTGGWFEPGSWPFSPRKFYLYLNNQLLESIPPPPTLLGVTSVMRAILACPTEISAGIFKQSIGARNRVGIGLSHRPDRLQRLAELVPLNRFLGSIKVEKFGLRSYTHLPGLKCFDHSVRGGGVFFTFTAHLTLSPPSPLPSQHRQT
jgi:hypothetical protein